MVEWSGTRLYLGNLPKDTRRQDVEEFFNEIGHGNITEVKLMDGFGFIQYDNPDDAKDIVPAFHGKDFKGHSLIVQFARGNRHHNNPRPDFPPQGPNNGFPPRPRRTPFRMNITGLPPDTSWQDLKDFARKSNDNVVFSDMGRDRDGRGTVEFETHEDLKRAVAYLDSMEYRGYRVTCVADVQDVAPGAGNGGGRYGGGGYGGPRGRSRSPHRGGGGGYGGRYSPPAPRGGGGNYGSPPPPRYGGRSGGRYDTSPPPHGGYRHRSPRRGGGGGGGGGGREPYYGGDRDRSDRSPPRRPMPPIDDYPPPRGGAGYGGGSGGNSREEYTAPRRAGYEDEQGYHGGHSNGGRGSRYEEPRGRYPSPVPAPRAGRSSPPRGGPPPRGGGGGYDEYDRRRY